MTSSQDKSAHLDGPALRITGEGGDERTVPLAGRDLRIGRSSENDVVLPDANKGVSRTHAELRAEAGRYVIVDLHSQNGTWINGERVERATVPVGAEIAIGLYRLRLETGTSMSASDGLGEIVLRGQGPQTVPPPPRDALAPAVMASRGRSSTLALVVGALAALAVLAVLARPWWPSRAAEGVPAAPQPSVADVRPSSPPESRAEPAPLDPLVKEPPAEPPVPPAAAPDTRRVPNPTGDRAAAREAFEAGGRLDAAGDWLGALRKYDQARELDASFPGLDGAAKGVWEKMRVAGRTALNRAREYDGIGQSVEALKEYDKAAQWLPPDDPNRALARQRADVLRAGGK